MPVSTDGGRLRRLCAAALAVQLGAACAQRSAPDASATSAPSATPPAGLTPPALGPAPPAVGSVVDEIAPVYPKADGAPDPLAAQLCEALHALPARRKAACCGGGAGFHAAAECTRALSFAVRAQAVTLSPGEVGRCVEGMERSLEGCDWVTPLAATIPAACEGIVRGALGDGARCRSSLECAGGLRCDGAGPTDAGVCRAPLAAGPCGLSVDALAAVTRQTRYAEAHPECRGHCAGRACAPDVPLGGRCEDHAACGRGRRCVDARCSDAPLPPAGAACLGGLCAPGARCVEGRCGAPRAEGEACARDAECRAACVRPDGRAAGAGGVCGKRCAAAP
ncbi:alpha-ketoglutarate decarboxylase [Sorangium cellulosum]|uniref:Alpha-ketoglutarate decarboxylase n=1 Tax=Sorangium cellulosum TaxID=56 RepID=A0A2L0F6A8_SORCE|nr:hypothetical protein [Sorangium cellulosum]AUX47124.1 alpha-ketoglutarate decarboxylase [Sorangium cellulosum]